MKIKYLLFVGLIIALGSCSTAYRVGQTPDDVYYSPAPEQDAYVVTNNQRERDSYSYNNDYNSEDMEIRRGIAQPRYRNSVSLDLGYGYGYSPYNSYGYGGIYNPYVYSGPYGIGSPHGYNSYGYSPYGYGYYDPYYSNYFYSPYNNYYYSPQVYISPTPQGTVMPATGARRYNLGAYSNSGPRINSNNSNATNGYRPTTQGSVPVRSGTIAPATNNNGRSGVGNFMRRVFTPSENNRNSNRVERTERNNDNYNNNNNNNNNYNSSPTRSSSQPGSSSSSSGSGSAPSRTFRR